MNNCATILLRKVSELATVGRFASYRDIDGFLQMSPAKIRTFQTNPYLESDDETAQIVGVCGDSIVGEVCPLPLPIVADADRLVSCGASHLWVNPEYRKTGIAFDISETTISSTSGKVCVNAYVSEKARKVASLMGAAVFPLYITTLYRTVKSLISGRRHATLLKLAVPFLDFALYVHRLALTILAKVKSRRYVLREAGFDDAVAVGNCVELIRRDAHRFRADIDEKWFTWVSSNDFADVAKAGCRLYLVEIGGRLVGFFMTRNSYLGGRIIEWQIASPHEGVTGWLMLRIALGLLRHGADSAVMCVPDDSLAVFFHRLGLHGIFPQGVSVHPADDSPLRTHTGWDDAANWRLRPSMGDAAFF